MIWNSGLHTKYQEKMSDEKQCTRVNKIKRMDGIQGSRQSLIVWIKYVAYGTEDLNTWVTVASGGMSKLNRYCNRKERCVDVICREGVHIMGRIHEKVAESQEKGTQTE